MWSDRAAAAWKHTKPFSAPLHSHSTLLSPLDVRSTFDRVKVAGRAFHGIYTKGDKFYLRSDFLCLGNRYKNSIPSSSTTLIARLRTLAYIRKHGQRRFTRIFYTLRDVDSTRPLNSDLLNISIQDSFKNFLIRKSLFAKSWLNLWSENRISMRRRGSEFP